MSLPDVDSGLLLRHVSGVRFLSGAPFFFAEFLLDIGCAVIYNAITVLSVLIHL